MDAEKLLSQYKRYSAHVVIPSKDEGLTHYRPWGTQIYLREQIIRGISEGVHEFVCVKPRQVGSSTELLAFDSFWLQRHSGLQGAVVTEKDKNTVAFRSTFSSILKALPVRYSWPLLTDNRILTQWATLVRNGQTRGGSRLMYLTAGEKENKTLGRGLGLSFAHGSEVAYWGDPDGFSALRSSLSERHPYRCAIWESTANGFNWFYDLWCDAQRAVTIRPIFIPWWRHELYSVAESSKVYQVYWDGSLTSEERAWQREITIRWKVEITSCQWAWYRWKFAEGKGEDQIRMHEDYPTLPEHAFQASGMGFLGAHIMARLREGLGASPPAHFYRYHFGPLIEDSRLEETSEAMGQLAVWEEPRDGGHYVVTADPSFAASPDSDQAVCQVWRAERTRLIQVAEFAANDVPIHQFAWVCCHLLGVYQRAFFHLEVSGPGYGVLQEMQRIEAWGWGTNKRPAIQSVLGGVQHYIYRRADSLGGTGIWHTQTTPRVKAWMMTRLRDSIISQKVTLRSHRLVEELNSFSQEGDRFGAQGNANDDRVIAAGLAVEQWQEQVIPILMMTPQPPSEEDIQAGIRDPLKDPTPVHEHLVRTFFQKLGA